jgi:Domain of unknown function (DUF4062)
MNLADAVEIRLEALRGDFGFNAFTAPKRELKVFVSSTFTDTHEERNIMLNGLLPLLRELARSRGIAVFLFDMRSGFPDTNTLDHHTWENCYRELRRCYDESGGIFFLSLQADKYGYMPLPKVVDKDVYEERLRSLSDDMRNLAGKWYYLDTNAIPPAYVLKSLTGSSEEDGVFWNVVRPALCEALDSIMFDPAFEEVFVGRSVTEYETKSALLLCNNDTCGVNNRQIDRVKWIHRHFTGGVREDQDPRGLLFDGRQQSVALKLNNLKAWMRSLLPESCIKDFEISVDAFNAKGDNEEWKVRLQHQHLFLCNEAATMSRI